MRIRIILLAVAAIVGLSSGTQAQSGATPILGSVMIFAGNFCPQGWFPMEGQLLPINQYTALFSILGTTYGGNGTSNFALPKAKPFVTYGNKQTMTQCIAYLGIFPSRN
jgi:microcystin-dependent protein